MTDPTGSPQAALEKAWGHQIFPTPHKPLSDKSGGHGGKSKSVSKSSGRGGKTKRHAQ